MTQHQYSDLLRLAVDESPDLVLVADLETGRLVEGNSASLRVLGYTRDELLDLSTWDVDNEVTEDLYFFVRGQLATLTNSIAFRTRYRRKDGSLFDVDFRVTITAREGRHFAVSVARDITEQVKLEAALRESQEHYASLVRNLPGVVHRCLLDHPNTILYIDDRIEGLTGVPAQQFIEGARALDEFVSDADRDAIGSAWQLAAERTGNYDVTMTFRLPGGETRIVQEVGHVIRPEDGKPAIVEGMLIDITERSERERVLREAFDAEHLRFERVVAASHQVVYEGNSLDQTMHFSGPLKEVFGYTPDSLNHSAQAWRDRIHPDDHDRVIREHREKPRPGELIEFEYRWLHADGAYRWVWDRAVFDFDLEGRPTRVLGVMQDVTSRKDLESQVSASQRMETVGALAAGLAHDVNNFLTSILGNIDFALMRLDNDPDWPELADARTAALGCAELVQNLLTFARPRPADRRLIDPRELLTSTVRILRRLAGPNIEITTYVGPSAPHFEGDMLQLQQVLMNLVANAKDAMQGRGSIVIHADGRTLEEPGASGDYLCIAVTDDGPGIPRSLHTRIFEPYFTTRPFGEGTGLGLSIVHGIARSHGGRVLVDSTEGHGATFSVYFPARRPD